MFWIGVAIGVAALLFWAFLMFGGSHADTNTDSHEHESDHDCSMHSPSETA